MATPIPLDISDDQRFALMKFRRNVRDCLGPLEDDHYLLRWLRARNWDPDAAEKMLRESKNWREHWKVDDLETWTAPEVIEKYYVAGITGFDKEGSPVIIVPFGNLDMWGVVHSAQRADFVRYTLQTIERYLRIARKQSEVHGIKARKLVAIIDMEGFNIRQYLHKPAGELAVGLVKMYESNYPEVLKACYIINATRLFFVAFSLIKNFLNDEILSKIHIFKSDKKKYTLAILSNIEPDQIPEYYGGTQVDENGDIKCSMKVRQGGKIPKSYYKDFKNDKGQDDLTNEYVVSEVKKSDKLILDYKAPTPNSILRYDFKVEGPDIKFGVIRVDENGLEKEEVALHKVGSSKINELGIVTHDGPALYHVIFDNTGSMLRTAKIHHHIQILPPLSSDKDSLGLTG